MSGATGPFYPRSPCGERPLDRDADGAYLVLSIHALLAESDAAVLGTVPDVAPFYPRSPCGERQDKSPSRCCACPFYPRSPCGERQTSLVVIGTNCILSIHALLAESDAPQQENGQAATLSIHALLAESDIRSTRYTVRHLAFLSTLSLRRATFTISAHCFEGRLSIHALLAESDCDSDPVTDKAWAPFYPRSPCGERPVFQKLMAALLHFLSTLSLRRATVSVYVRSQSCTSFYPRSPCGERPTV